MGNTGKKLTKIIKCKVKKKKKRKEGKKIRKRGREK